MPQTLGPIPLEVPVTDRGGNITEFFRLRWEELRTFVTRVGTRAIETLTGQTAAIATTTVLTLTEPGLYEVSYYLRKTFADGVNSSLQFTWGWTESGLPLTENAATVTLDTTSAQQSGSKVVRADASSDLTFAVAYASNTPNRMTFRIDVIVKQLA